MFGHPSMELKQVEFYTAEFYYSYPGSWIRIWIQPFKFVWLKDQKALPLTLIRIRIQENSIPVPFKGKFTDLLHKIV